METTVLGKTGLEVTRLGAGLAEVGQEHTLDGLSHVGRVLNGALDGGINFLDTTPILGTRNPTHMAANQQLIKRLPIADEVVRELRRRFDEAEDNWRQLN
jgi:aryl-alcohol dehydrogenase-like predicted oxidoreductase